MVRMTADVDISKTDGDRVSEAENRARHGELQVREVMCLDDSRGANGDGKDLTYEKRLLEQEDLVLLSWRTDRSHRSQDHSMSERPMLHTIRLLTGGMAAFAVSTMVVGCVGGGVASTPNDGLAAAVGESVWRTLADPRPSALDGAVRVSVGQVELPESLSWGLGSSVSPALGFSDLVATGLLRRADIQFVERRRFGAAAELARRGALPSGSPQPGVSPGPEFILSVTWSSFGMADAYLDMRLANSETGVIEKSWREVTPSNAGPVGLARVVVGSLVEALAGMGRAPVWSDPVANAAPAEFRSAGVSGPGIVAYLEGLAAEERWDWEGARRGYQSALASDGGLFEAGVALPRTARLRLGGTLGGN